MTDEQKFQIIIEFEHPNSVSYSLDVSPGITVEQMALIAARLRFLANYQWTNNEHAKFLDAAQAAEEERKKKIPIAKSKVLRPQ